ncbi:MAG: diacylglycerol kinase family lipid kinase, partial [Anaerolineae bacterium]|nr:diacylglycerol kinase family lipid kinase [Anaerolineae bacterium]
VTNRAGDGRRLAEEAVEKGVDLVAVYGGDGTLMEVSSGLVGGDVPLAILPGGTGNVMSVELGIPRELDRATELIFQEKRRIRHVDVGQIGERYFMLRASVGFEATVVKKSTRDMKDRFGLLAYGFAILEALNEPLHARYELTLDDREIETDGFSLLIANAGSLGRLNLILNSAIKPDDGLLDVMMLNNHPEHLVSIAASAVQLDEFTAQLQHWQAREIKVVSHPLQTVQGDGELFCDTPFTAQVVPGAVQVIVPD